MRPEGRLQAVIELLDQWHATGGDDADRVVVSYLKDKRYVGSSDRREISHRFHDLIRHQARLGWWCKEAAEMENPDARARVIAELAIIHAKKPTDIAELFNGGQYGPATLNPDEMKLAQALQGKKLDHAGQPAAVKNELPRALQALLFQRFGEKLGEEMAALNGSAPLDLRINTLKSTVGDARQALEAEGFKTNSLPFNLPGLRLENGTPIAQGETYRAGLVEVQDAASQICAALVAPEAGQRVLDMCAGGGGKTLALAAAMKNRGKIVACDTHGQRLDNARKRASRAKASNIQFRLIADERDTWLRTKSGFFDRVLVDAPCSGAGTWRRNPAARWRLGRRELADFSRVQYNILKSAAQRVTWGGRLIYATCSIFEEENEKVVTGFLRDRKEFRLVPVEKIRPDLGISGEMVTLTPHRNQTDGFFIAVMERVKKR